MTPTRFICKSTSRRDWFDWVLVDADTGLQLDRGGANKSNVANAEACKALAAFERRMVEGPPTEEVEVELVVAAE
jgi:hypothetical protein